MADNNNHAPKAKREQWGSSFGFILATAGSAVGLGNIMKFPWMTGQYGGATFLVTYIIVMIFVGAFMLMADFLIGRNGKCSAIFAYRKIDGRFTWMGYLGVFSALLAEAYYAVFGGWMMYYIVMSFGPLAHMADAGEVGAFFGSFISSPIGPLVGALIFHILTTIIVVGGIKGGIEKASKVMMPALLVILIVLVIRALTLPNIGEGITYYLKPDLSKMSIGLVAAAVGQCFFSLNIGTTGMVNYGSYLPDSENIPSSTVKIVIADFVVAFLAGLIIIPSAFAFGIDVGSGPSLLFVTMPSLFARLPMPWLWNLLFFVLLAVLMWAFLHTKTGTAMTAVGSNPAFARAAGINVDKMRLISVIMSTWLGAVGILVYEQGFGFIQLYNGPFWMAMPAVAAILIGGASVNKASIGNVIIGTILYQGVVTMTPTVMSAAFQMDMSEVIRIVVSNGMILYALTRKTERGR